MIGFKSSLYWIGVSCLLISFFYLTGTPFVQTIYFVSFLMPVVIVTSYYFNEQLIPKYLSPGKYWLFTRYTIYTIVFALFTQAIILFLSLLLFSNYQTDQLNGLCIDLLSLGFGTLLIILINAFSKSIKTLRHQQKTIDELTTQIQSTKSATLTIRANRRSYQIPLEELMFIESRGDYVHLQSTSQVIKTKERISKLMTKLPEHFIRIHRSFIVNKNMVQSYNHVKIDIGKFELPISRTYKKSVLQIMSGVNSL